MHKHENKHTHISQKVQKCCLPARSRERDVVMETEWVQGATQELTKVLVAVGGDQRVIDVHL